MLLSVYGGVTESQIKPGFGQTVIFCKVVWAHCEMAHLTSPSTVEMRTAERRQPKMPKVAETVRGEVRMQTRVPEIKFVALTLLTISGVAPAKTPAETEL